MNQKQIMTSHQVALQVVQQAIAALADWAGFAHPPLHTKNPEVSRAKEILGWNQNTKIGILRLLFDGVNLSQEHRQDKRQPHYHQLSAIENQDGEYPLIPYPLCSQPDDSKQKEFKEKIKTEVFSSLKDNWDNLSFLMLIIEKFGSCLSFGESDVALVDMARATAAVAAALVNNPTEEISLIAGDLSGIQKFIYTISSEGALKSLRARSFYLELVTQEVVQQSLDKVHLPPTNVIYAGGGNLYILAAGTEENRKNLNQVRRQVNEWLLKKFQGKVFLALDCLKFPLKEITTATFAAHWSNATKHLAVYKSRKFAQHQISDFIASSHSHEPCRVCHRDDVETEALKPLNSNEPDSVLSCETCRNMFDLGSNLFGVKAIVRSKREDVGSKLPTLSFELPAVGESPAVNIYYHLFKTWKPIVPDSDLVLLVNDWSLEHYQFKHFQNVSPLLLGNYGKQSEEEQDNTEETKGFIRAEEMAKKATGINRVGYLRMDVDRLGQIFAKGLGENQTLPRLAGLSRQMSYFFKVYLNSLAEKRYDNFIQHRKRGTTELVENAQCLTEENRDNLLFIYAGGDDLFISGAWNETVEFAFDIYQCFRAYTGNNPDITLSGGISIDDIKFPLYQAAKSSGEAEDKAKANGRDSLGLFDQVFKWDEWLEIKDIHILDPDSKKYLHLETKPKILGVLPFVKKLKQQDIGVNYSRNFVRNLLITAQIQDQELKKFEENKKSEEALATRYYLHLPKIAYTLARLPKNVLDDSDFRTSLKSPYNAPYFRAIANKQIKQILNSIISQDIYENELIRYLNFYLEALKKIETHLQNKFVAIEHYLASVNDFLEGKKLEIAKQIFKEKETFIQVKFNDNSIVSGLGALSSGERQIVTMLYAATHMSQEHIVLIDEPEISLHIDWQRLLLKKMSEQLRNRQIIACTHSPYVAEDYDSCLKELELKPTDKHLWIYEDEVEEKSNTDTDDSSN